MQSVRLGRSVAPLAVMAVLLAACTAGGPTGDPTTVVEQALQLVEQGQYEDLADLACTEKRDQISAQLGLGRTFPGTLPPGFDPTALAAAFTLGTDGLAVSETARTGEQATVHVEGTLDVTVDEEQLGELIRDSGLIADEAVLDQIVAGLAAQLGQGIPFDEDITVVSEGGAWKIC